MRSKSKGARVGFDQGAFFGKSPRAGKKRHGRTAGHHTGRKAHHLRP